MNIEALTAAADADGGRLGFASLIRQVALDASARGNVLCDAHHQIRYEDVPEALDRIRDYLSSAGIAGREPIVLELTNSVRGALSVLAVLSGGMSVLTVPVRGQGARTQEGEEEDVRFCRFVVTVNSDPSEQPIESLDPSQFLTIRDNPSFKSSPAVLDDDRPRIFFRTSGSLGVVKIAVFGYTAFLRNCLNVLKARKFGVNHRIALPTPIFHNYGLGSGLIAGLAGGASIDLQERSNVLKYFERERAFNPNVAYATPMFCEMLVRSRRKPRPYEFLIVAGDTISESTFTGCEDLHGKIIPQYGSTEMCLISSASNDDPFDVRVNTVGRPGEGVAVRIAELPPEMGETGMGELQIRHEYGFQGYVALSGEELIPAGAFDGDWFRTGDLARLSDDGYLSIHGRCDMSVNRNGLLLPLADVEMRMRAIEHVDEVAVIASGGEGLRGRNLTAFCVLARNSKVGPAELRSAYAVAAPAYAIPDTIHILDALPKLASGKLDRVSLSKQLRDYHSRSERTGESSIEPA